MRCLDVRHDSFIRVTSLVHMCDATHSYVWHDSFWRAWWQRHHALDAHTTNFYSTVISRFPILSTKILAVFGLFRFTFSKLIFGIPAGWPKIFPASLKHRWSDIFCLGHCTFEEATKTVTRLHWGKPNLKECWVGGISPFRVLLCVVSQRAAKDVSLKLET